MIPDHNLATEVATFFVAGQETSSSATTWTLFSLTQEPQYQVKLREELLTLATDTPSMEELNNLPYLDAVVREALRLHSPAPITIRVAKENDVIPLEKPFADVDGKMQNEIKIKKGESVIIPIKIVNRSEKIWGKDAAQFRYASRYSLCAFITQRHKYHRPERWESLPDAARKIPGIWGNQLTFLGGSHSCIGYKFALVEIKALLFALIRAFEFELAVPLDDIKIKRTGVGRPILASDPSYGPQLPMKVKSYLP